MNYSTVNILDLSDEMVLTILNKLNNIDVLYSFIGVNRKLDRLARDITFTQSIDLATISSNEHDDSRNESRLDRFCFDIIPRIQDNIECLTLDPLSTDRVLSIGSYSKLHKLTLVNFQLEMASRIFNDGSSFNIFKHKISHLTITINDGSTAQYIRKSSTNVLTNILTMFTNLTYLHFCLKDICHYPPTSFIDLVSTTCYPSNIIHLNVRVRNFNDCLCLLDGRLYQLQTFIVEVDKINTTSMTINHSRILSNLKCFSLTSYRRTCNYDNQIVPLLRQMSQLEKLTLSLIVRGRISFIDGNHLVNHILNLEIVTGYFTNNAARANCSKLTRIIFDSPPMIYSENFHLYFPLLYCK
ncbi:unnamed protein product [Rotaria sordida]|uniref:F-box domain-containing protein n=1 Tax=Rotaria sordida TaxID=392033 RepID=A0A815K2Z5_9BILA|nr:unnamed protein product [Rotaria sordida]CAF1387387.1 unnamed protein product [Rotaria sordida]